MTTESSAAGLPDDGGRRYIRLQIELIAEIVDEKALQAAALEQVEKDEYLEDDERAEAIEAINVDPSGAIAHFIDPVAMLEAIPGVDLAEAGWETQPVDYDEENEDWELLGEDDE
ncbi:hypothetical protein [Streptacidiphilus fuscans]|uniref:Uncharacterized protein n=1 Tax=Streptacidiphilus fuscans TaxID=2789292 RepID=A0A931AZM9_9ACTN|nr:hypothetical protein [Streptacidiphilus fuscans]MBF9067764.1 hypothetical protein [Streptacidiphilus fuscans]